MSTALIWVEASIDELSVRQFHDLLKLRFDVFVVEQSCIYPELDGQDALVGTQHIFATNTEGEVIAAARVLSADESRPVRIGRVVVTASLRGTGLSRQLMDRVMAYCARQHQHEVIELSAQVGADAFYAAYGFKVISEDYMDDGIMHRDMRLMS